MSLTMVTIANPVDNGEKVFDHGLVTLQEKEYGSLS